MEGRRKGEAHGLTRVNPFFFSFPGLGDRPAGLLSLLLRGGVRLPPGLLHECHQPRHPPVPGRCDPQWWGDTGGPWGTGRSPAGPSGELDLGWMCLGLRVFRSEGAV